MLGHVSRRQMGQIPARGVHMADGAAMGDFSQQGADQGGFAGAVLADEDGQLAAVDMHGHILQQRLSSPADGNPVQINMAEGTAVNAHGNTP